MTKARQGCDFLLSTCESDAASRSQAMGPKESQRVEAAHGRLCAQYIARGAAGLVIYYTVGDQTGLGVGSDGYIRSNAGKKKNPPPAPCER